MDFFTPFGVGDTFVRVAYIFRLQWKPFLTVSVIGHALTIAAIMGSYHVVWLLQGGSNAEEHQHHWSGKRMKHNVSYYGLSDVITFSIEMVVYSLFMSIPEGAIVRGVAEIYAGREPVLKDLVVRATGRLRYLLGACCILTLAYMVPLLFPDLVATTIVDGMWLAKLLERIFMILISVLTFVVFPAIMIENREAIKGIDRSIELSTNHRTYIFAVMAIYALAKFVFEKIVFDIEKTPHFVRFITWMLLSVLFSCLEFIFKAVVYLNIRVSKESMSREVLEGDLDNAGGDPDDPLARYLALSGGDEEDEVGALNEMIFDEES